MEFHKSLYKSINAGNTENSPKGRIKKNLKYGQSKRIEMFQKNRKFSVSPTLTEIISNQQGKNDFKSTALRRSINNKNKENSGIIKVNETISKQEAYIAKFLAWKKQKKNEKLQQLQKKRPFVSSCSANIMSSGIQKSFVPVNHQFKAPVGLVVPSLTENFKYKIRNLEKESPIEVQVSNSPKKIKDFIVINKKLISTPKLRQKLEPNIKNSSTKLKELKKTPMSTRSKMKTENKLPNKNLNFNNKHEKEMNIDGKKINSGNSNLNTNFNKVNPGAFVKSSKVKTTILDDKQEVTKHILLVNKKNRVQHHDSNEIKKSSNILKKEIEKKEKDFVAPEKKNVLIISPAKISKEKKTPFLVEKTPHKNKAYLKREKNSNLHNTNAKDVKKVKKNSKTNLQNIETKTKSSKLILFEKPKIVLYQETPDENAEKPNTSFITSTQRKHSPKSLGIVPTELKESILSPIENDILGKDEKNKLPLIDLSNRKSMDCKVKENEILATPLDNTKCNDLNVTPLMLNDENKPITYVSPYVTMSRGKGSIKKEKKLRESIYLLDESNDGAIAELRKVKETVRYFRKMLEDEIIRLHRRCEEWEQYCKDTKLPLLEDYGYDMVNVAVGQTKLLTSRKFQQFKNLMDQCEKFAHSKYELKKINDDTEKPILPEDLEGFWQMMYIQVDDIDERFRKLDAWRSNDWKDPEERKSNPERIRKKEKLLSKVSKKKKSSEPSTEIKQKLKEIYLKHRQEKRNEEEQNKNNIIILLPSKTSGKSINNNDDINLTPVRRSKRLSSIQKVETPMDDSKIVTPSRKSLRIETAVNAASKLFKENMGTPKHNLSEFRLISLIKTPCIACSGDTACSPFVRKSILKTPGTHKKRQTVIFNEELQFKSPGKPYSSNKKRRDTESSFSRKSLSANSNKRKRSLNLRGRRLVVDPEAKIDIPSKI